MPRTLEDLRKAQAAAAAEVDADLKAQAELDTKIKADLDAKVATTTDFAAGIKKAGDFFDLNPDGTATAFFASATAADGFYSELLKPSSTPVT